MIIRAVILMLCVVYGAAHADHRDVCHGFADVDDQNACYAQADVQLEIFVNQNQQLFTADGIVKIFIENAHVWASPLLLIATTIFWTLALIEFILTFSMMAIRGSDLAEFAVEFLTRVLIISFGAYLLSDHAILFAVIDGFRDSASVVLTGQPGTNYDIGRMLEIPLAVVTNMYKAAKSLNPVTDIVQIVMIIVTAVIVLWALAIASVQLILILCEMYIVLTIGLLSLGFFSLKITREYPMRFFGGLIGTGFKLLALELIISVGLVMVDSWSNLPVMHRAGPYMLIAAAAVMYKEIAVRIPNYIQSLLTASPGSGVSAQGAVTAAGVVAGAGVAAGKAVIPGAGTVGRAMAVSDAVTMARGAGATGAGVIGGAIGHLLGAKGDMLRKNNPAAAQMRENRLRGESGPALKNPKTKE